MSLLITCDTGGWKTPPRLKTRLVDEGLSAPLEWSDDSVLTSGQDRSAYLAARKIASHCGCDVICNELRSDLVDVGRSKHHRDLFPPAVRELSVEMRDLILDEIYFPYRRKVRRRLSDMLLQSTYVVHLSIRTFQSKNSGGDWLRGDVGLAYDASRGDEVDWCLDLMDELWTLAPELKIRRNHPRRGTNDSLTRAMRQHFHDVNYLGIEVLLNQSWAAREVPLRDNALHGLAEAIRSISPQSATQAA